jgi:divalent metal cation (Fe/Co/Zn/Cd) transporter
MKNLIIYTGISLILFFIGISILFMLLSGINVDQTNQFLVFGTLAMLLFANLSSFLTNLWNKRKRLNVKMIIASCIFAAINVLFIVFYLASTFMLYLLA